MISCQRTREILLMEPNNQIPAASQLPSTRKTTEANLRSQSSLYTLITSRSPRHPSQFLLSLSPSPQICECFLESENVTPGMSQGWAGRNGERKGEGLARNTWNAYFSHLPMVLSCSRSAQFFQERMASWSPLNTGEAEENCYMRKSAGFSLPEMLSRVKSIFLSQKVVWLHLSSEKESDKEMYAWKNQHCFLRLEVCTVCLGEK